MCNKFNLRFKGIVIYYGLCFKGLIGWGIRIGVGKCGEFVFEIIGDVRNIYVSFENIIDLEVVSSVL